uniref:Uncharacterized protein n=1 Tax=Sphaerodactylus townsendi TaxID=933632 RepID=A0ACB8EA02_9SAUR
MKANNDIVMAGSARSTIDKKSLGKVSLPPFLAQLAAVLDNPSIKSLEVKGDGLQVKKAWDLQDMHNAGMAASTARELGYRGGDTVPEMLVSRGPERSASHVFCLPVISGLGGFLRGVTVCLLPQWHEDGKSILLHAKLYEEEIQGHQELFPELKNLRSVSVFQAWLTTYGFKARTTKIDSEVLIFQHADFKKLSPKAEEADGSKAETPVILKQPKKSKKRKSSLDIIVNPASSTGSTLSPESAGVERKSQRLRPLYQYINYGNPEMNSPSEKECDLPPLEIPPILENKAGPLELRIPPPKVAEDKGRDPRSPKSASPGVAAKAEVDKSTQVDIDKMLSVCAAHLVPPLSPQHK